MKLGLELVAEWLKDNLDKKILIRKQEKEALDEVLIHLKLTEYRGERSDAIDSYVSDSALLLHGNGSVITEGLEVDLPSNIYEIPLKALEHVEATEDSLRFKTERAQYLLTVQ